MILCITPNPALDRTLTVSGYTAGGVFRPDEVNVKAGGKGINVARAVAALGGNALCAGFLGGYQGRYLASLAAAEGLNTRWIFVDHVETRICTILVDPATGQSTGIYEAGFDVSEANWHHLLDVLQPDLDNSCYISFSGSLPAASSLPHFSNMLHRLTASGHRVWVDTSGAALAEAARIPGIALKVNTDEISELLGEVIVTPEDSVHVARQLQQKTLAPVVITLGAMGAVWVDKARTYEARPPRVTAVNAVGSGDSFLAGLLLALEAAQAIPEAMRQAVAVGTANSLSVSGASFSLADVERLSQQVMITSS